MIFATVFVVKTAQQLYRISYNNKNVAWRVCVGKRGSGDMLCMLNGPRNGVIRPGKNEMKTANTLKSQHILYQLDFVGGAWRVHQNVCISHRCKHAV